MLAVPHLGERSGGVGQVSSLLWRAVSETWPGESAVVALLRDGRDLPTISDKVGFGWAMGRRQLTQPPRWIVFAHLGLARVERFIPVRARAPYAVFLHGVEAWCRLPPSDVDLLNGARLRLVNSAFTARRVREVNPEVESLDVCPLALPEEPAGDPSGRESRHDGQTVLVVGRMAAGERYKGHEQLIDVWPDVVKLEPEARLVIVGDGDDRPRLEAKARASVAAGRIRFAGFLPRRELDALYEMAAVFAMPSRSEGFGLVYLEAMAHQLPCIGSIHDAAGEIVSDGESGRLVDTDRPDELVGALVDLLGDRDLRTRMGRAGYERWKTQFSYARFKERAVTLLERSLEQPSPERLDA